MLGVQFTDRNVKKDISYDSVSHQAAVPATVLVRQDLKAILTVAKLSGIVGELSPDLIESHI